MLRSTEPNWHIILADLDDWLADPLFWFSIGFPAIVLAIAALYFLWIDYKARKLFRAETRSAKKRGKP